MTPEQWTAVDTYVEGLFTPPDVALDAALAASVAANLPAIQISPTQGKFLLILARAVKARRILEIGTLGGYSTIWLARALPSGGCLITLEADEKHADIAQKNIANAGLADLVELRLGRAQDTLPKLIAEDVDPFDLIFIDADKPGYTNYLKWSLQLSRRGTLIVADNVVRDGAVLDPNSADEAVQGVRRYNEALAAEPRVAGTIIQTVGSKGYDGFAIAVVTADI